jgi:Putative zinc-finger
MDHQQATQLMAVEKYLLQELAPEARDQFEEHFFDCQECATDLGATVAFMEAAQREFRLNPLPKPAIAPKAGWGLALLRPVTAWSALAASLLVIAYQNVMVYPHFESQIAELRAPEILPSLSLVNGNTRGGQAHQVTVGAGRPFLLLLDIPIEDRFSSYTCLLYSPSGALSWRVDVSPQQAKDTVPVSVSSANRPPGDYTLVLQGNLDRGAVELQRYRFTLNQP